MEFRANKPLRNLGVYLLLNRTLILLKRTDTLSFLFTPENWQLHGPVEYRVSHGQIFARGMPLTLSDEDLVDTGMTAEPPRLYVKLDE